MQLSFIPSCYGLNVSPAKLTCWNLTPPPAVFRKVMLSGDGPFERHLDHEAGAFMSGISAFIEEAPQGLLSSSAMGGYNGKSETRKRNPSLDHTGTLIQTPSFQNSEKYITVVYKLPVCGICYSSPNGLKHKRNSQEFVNVLCQVGKA